MAFDKAAFSARLRGKRAELDITQQQLADRCGNVSAAAIAQYGNDGTLKTVLGSRYDEVQKIVNSSSSTSRTYTVKSGNTLSGIGAMLGVDWKTIASKNGISEPYTIYPGQALTI